MPTKFGVGAQTTKWQCPPFTAPPEERMGWVEEQLEEGEGWLSSQKSYQNYERNLRVFDAVFNDKTKSTLITNSLKYNIRKFVETVSEVREIGTYGSDAPQYKLFAEMLNKLVKAVYLESDFPVQLRRALQYAAVFGRGYIWTKCKTGNYGFGERKLIFEPLGLLDVVPIQMPSTNDVQDAYANTIYEYMPIAEAHGRFPLYQSRLQAVDRVNTSSRVQAKRLDNAERYRGGTESRNFGNLYCEIRYTFIRDISVNPYEKPVPMGQPNTSWFYEVPFVGQPILGGVRNSQPFMRPANNQDCLLYPYLRLIISSKGMTEPMYDGPAFDWHGQMPAVQYDVDDLPWEGVGRSLVGDVADIETTKRKIERKIDQVITTTLNPPMGYDRTATGGPKVENFDIFEENVRAGVDGKPADVMQSLLPESVRVTDVHFKWLEYLNAAEGKQLGLEDMGNLANLKMNIASETAEKMLESIGPVGKGMAGNVERANAKIAFQLKFHCPQWYDTARVVSIIGPNNVTPEVFDFDPTSLIPSHMADEIVVGQPPPTGPSHYSQLTRARMFAKNIRLVSVPSTLLRVTQMQEQMKWLQLYRGGAPIAFADVAKKLDIENYGDVKGATLRERWFNEQLESLKLKAMAAQAAAALGMGGDDGPGGGGKPKGKGGRPPSGKKPPHFQQKGKNSGNPRTVISES